MAFISSKPSHTVHGLVKSLSCVCLSSYQGKMKDFNGAYKRSSENTSNIYLDFREGHWSLEAETLPWQNGDSIAQHKTSSYLILCNPQLERLILQGVMLLFSGISTESFMRWTCVHYDAF